MLFSAWNLLILLRRAARPNVKHSRSESAQRNSLRRHAERLTLRGAAARLDSPAVAKAPSRAEFDRLTAECERLRAAYDALRRQVLEQQQQLKVQFTRIAEMQAILDEERIAGDRPRQPRPLYPARQERFDG